MCSPLDGSEDETIRTKRVQFNRGFRRRAAFSLVELLVVISIMAALAAIMVPVLGAARRKAYSLVGMTRLKHIAMQLNSFALENNNYYPPSISGYPDGTTEDPRRMTSIYPFTKQYRSMAHYLNGYIEDATVFHCPSSPEKYPYLNQMWEQGDDWICPGKSVESPMSGHFAFFWDYKGVLELEEGYELFRGPSRPSLGKKQSDLLVSDALVESDQQISPRPPESFSSCEYIPNGTVASSTFVASRWTCEVDEGLPDIRLKAAFVDTHVETYKAKEAVGLRPILSYDRHGNPEPWLLGSASGGSLGRYYLPASAQP